MPRIDIVVNTPTVVFGLLLDGICADPAVICSQQLNHQENEEHHCVLLPPIPSRCTKMTRPLTDKH